MPRACLFLRPSVSYRADAFRAGLKRLGFEIEQHYRRDPAPDDLLLLWNRNRGHEAIAEIYDRAGARVIIAENGYLGADDAGGKLFALALGQHNGAGRWHVGPEPRRSFDLRPWREAGDHILVLPQRGIGGRGVAMPYAWPDQVKARLAQVTSRPIRIRKHPGAAKSDPWPDLEGAHCAVTWGSGAGIKAIAYGIPVIHELPSWIGAPAARLGLDKIEDCFTGDRGPMFHRLSWAQWTSAEIESGTAFDHLLSAQAQRHGLHRAEQ